MIDCLGLEVTGSKEESLAAINDCIKRDLNYGDTSYTTFQTLIDNDPECPTLKILYIYLMILQEADNKEIANTLLPQIQNCNSRERLWIRSLLTLLNEGVCAAIPILSQIVDENPKDFFAAKFGIFMCLCTGRKPEMLNIVSYLQRESDHWQSAECCSFICFGYLENNLLIESENYGRRALELNPHNAWAQHNIGHIYAAKNEFENGIRVLEGHSEDWKGNFIYTHNWWHLAIFNVFLRNFGAAEEIFRTHVLGRNWWASVNVINSLAMLLYLDFFGRDVVGYLTPEFLEILRSKKILGAKRGLVCAMVIWALYKAGLHSEAIEIKDSQQGVIKKAAEVLLNLASGNKAEARRIATEEIPNIQLLGGSIEQNQALTDCLSMTRTEIFYSEG
ncbi:unnamed protein product [Blepharisma stoltei]|uniref:Tetratricopeptide repeat protein 38 n=1 Tax=Blepharisma stoltei TaxID=1481888 RepID=A0AAU9J9Q0_9CILI|nr:unnamed protein product [Blepharisma stoltei]